MMKTMNRNGYFSFKGVKGQVVLVRPSLTSGSVGHLLESFISEHTMRA